MKNRLIIILISFLFKQNCMREFNILAKNITIDKNKQSTIFENQVIITTEEITKLKVNML